MTTTSPDGEATPAPGAIDLEAIAARRKPITEYHGDLTYADVDNLIAAVEALRARVAELEDAYTDSEEQREYDAKATEAQVETARLEVEQCHAKSTCCCGAYMKQHTGYDGHSPVAMYDYALDKAETRAKDAEECLATFGVQMGAIRKGKDSC